MRWVAQFCTQSGKEICRSVGTDYVCQQVIWVLRLEVESDIRLLNRIFREGDKAKLHWLFEGADLVLLLGVSAVFLRSDICHVDWRLHPRLVADHPDRTEVFFLVLLSFVLSYSSECIFLAQDLVIHILFVLLFILVD